MNRLTFAILAAALAACGGGQKAGEGTATPANPDTTGPAEPAAPAAPAAPAEGGDYSGWHSWTKVNDAVFESKGHGGKPANVYVRPEHADWYKSLAEGMKAPVGFQVTKVHYKTPDAAEATAMLVMTKMEPGYDPDNGDWFYAIYDPTGTKAQDAGKLTRCIDCHAASDDTDFLGGLPK